jgi:hypothetical protein
MSNRILTILGNGLLLAMVVGPAMAGRPLPQNVPEPASLSLLAVGMGGAYVAKRFFGRK